MKLILLPGMDGTGKLFTDFVKCLPSSIDAEVVHYPTEKFLSYQQLESLVDRVVPMAAPFVLLAESFSTPIAVQMAATGCPNLRGIILVAGFVVSPKRGLVRLVVSLAAPLLFRVQLSKFAAKLFLTGRDVSPSLLIDVLSAVASVRPQVLAQRLRATFACDARVGLNEVQVPILYIQAKHDRLVSRSSLEEIRLIKPNVKVAFISAPHLLLQAEPQNAAAIVSDFMRKLL